MQQRLDDTRTLELLEAIDAREDLTQRDLAKRLGIAVGLTNSYLKRCVRKGLIKMKEAPANRYLYYLTPRGFAEKSRLTGQFLSGSLDFYRNTSNAVHRLFERCAQRGIHRIGLAGRSEIGEIAYLRARERGLQVLGVLAPESAGTDFLGLPVWRRVEDAPAVECWLFVELESAPERYDRLVAAVGAEQVLVPEVLLGLLPPEQRPQRAAEG